MTGSYSCCYSLMKCCYQVMDPSSGAGVNYLIAARQLTKLKNDKNIAQRDHGQLRYRGVLLHFNDARDIQEHDLFLPHTFCSYVITAELLFWILVVAF